jgi:hypothetical protein
MTSAEAIRIGSSGPYVTQPMASAHSKGSAAVPQAAKAKPARTSKLKKTILRFIASSSSLDELAWLVNSFRTGS